MTNKNQHVLFVAHWVDTLALPSHQSLKDVFQAAFHGVWRRAQLTLGEITLMAIGDRMVYLAGEAFPWLSVVTVDTDGINLSAVAASESQLREGLRFLLAEFLSVLHDLTGGVVTPYVRDVILKISGIRPPAHSLLDHRKKT